MSGQNNDEFTSPVFNMETLRRAIINPYGKRVIINGSPEGIPAQNSTRNDKANGVKAALFIIAFIGAIIAMAVFSQTEPILCIATFGAVVLFIGTVNLFQSGFSLENSASLLPPAAGLLLTGIPAVNVYHKSHPDSFYFSQSMVIDIILVCFIVVGVCLMMIPPIVRSNKLKQCTMTVNAVCIYRNTRDTTSKGANGMTRHYDLYAPTWQYELNGIIYVTRENDFTAEDVPDIGDMREIRCSPNDPSVIYRPLAVKRLAPFIVGLCFVGIAAVTLFVLHR